MKRGVGRRTREEGETVGGEQEEQGEDSEQYQYYKAT